MRPRGFECVVLRSFVYTGARLRRRVLPGKVYKIFIFLISSCFFWYIYIVRFVVLRVARARYLYADTRRSSNGRQLSAAVCSYLVSMWLECPNATSEWVPSSGEAWVLTTSGSIGGSCPYDSMVTSGSSTSAHL